MKLAVRVLTSPGSASLTQSVSPSFNNIVPVRIWGVYLRSIAVAGFKSTAYTPKSALLMPIFSGIVPRQGIEHQTATLDKARIDRYTSVAQPYTYANRK